MKVYLAWDWNGQGRSEHVVFATLEGAKQWLLNTLGCHDDWEWWVDDNGRHCYGEAGQQHPPIPEGTVEECDVLEF